MVFGLTFFGSASDAWHLSIDQSASIADDTVARAVDAYDWAPIAEIAEAEFAANSASAPEGDNNANNGEENEGRQAEGRIGTVSFLLKAQLPSNKGPVNQPLAL